MQLYAKNESGEFEPATDKQLAEVFKEKSDPIVARRIGEIREREVAKALEEARPGLEKTVREEISAKVRSEVEGEFKPQLEEANKAKQELEIALRRKTIAAEYGFKPETEEFLGNGTDEEMRAKADVLKNNFGSTETKAPEKQTAEPTNKLQEATGLDITI